MKKEVIVRGKELEFISLILRDGSGIIPIPTAWNTESNYPKTDDMSYLDEDKFVLNHLSISLKTFIASGFNTYIVKLKENYETMF